MLAKHALSQLSYSPEVPSDPVGPDVRYRLRLLERYARDWWARRDLNLRPHAYQARALTN